MNRHPIFSLVLMALTACPAAAEPTFGSKTGQPVQASMTVGKNRQKRKAIEVFETRVEQYLRLREKAIRKLGVLEIADSARPEVIEAREATVRSAIIAERASSRRGDVFTPETEGFFREAVELECAAPGKEQTLETIREVQPGQLRVGVNQVYPDDEPYSTMPPNLLRRLPVLPDHLEYRFVGRHLVLVDADAQLMLDYLSNVLPPREENLRP